MDTTMDKSAAGFETRDGRRINFISDWFARKKRWPLGIETFEEFVQTCIVECDYPGGHMFILNKLITTNTIAKLLEEYCYPFPPKASLLDICTGPAILPRVFKALNLANPVYGVDIVSRPTDGEELWNVWREVARQAAISEQSTAIYDNYALVNSIQTGLNNVFDILLSRPYDDGPPPEMDGYIVGDFLSQDYDSKFDLVTLAAGLEYFDVDDFFAKLSDVMNPGGYFVTLNDYFFELFGQSMHLPMDAPWMHARMSKDELMRYYSQHRPDIAECAKKAYYFPAGHRHFTVSDYKCSADKHGLEMLGYRRVITAENVKFFLFGGPMEKQYLVNEVLPDVRAMNDSVTPEDLFTSYLTMVFRRR